jgi:hypothetical protein
LLDGKERGIRAFNRFSRHSLIRTPFTISKFVTTNDGAQVNGRLPVKQSIEIHNKLASEKPTTASMIDEKHAWCV